MQTKSKKLLILLNRASEAFGENDLIRYVDFVRGMGDGVFYIDCDDILDSIGQIGETVYPYAVGGSGLAQQDWFTKPEAISICEGLSEINWIFNE